MAEATQARPKAATSQDLDAFQTAMDQRLLKVELTLTCVVNLLQISVGKLDEVLKATTSEPGPSKTTQLLEQMVESLAGVQGTLEDLPDNIATVIRDEMARAYMEDGGPGEFEPSNPPEGES